MNVTLYKPFPHQKQVHNAITNHINTVNRLSDEFQKTFIVKSCRQVGKSALVENELIRFALTFKGSVSAYLAPSFRLCRKLYKEILDMLKDTPLIVGTNGTGLSIELLNGSSIEFFSAEQRDKLRGFTVSGLLAIDEGAFISDSIFYNMVKVWTNAKRAVTLIVSSPDYESGFFYELHNEGLKGSEYIESFDFNDFDLSVIRSPRVLEEAKIKTPPQTFRSEYLGLYRKAEGSVFGNFESQILTHEPEAPTAMYFGIDFGTGSGGDYTVLVGINQNHEICFLWRDNESAPLEQAKYIGGILDKYKEVTKGVFAEENSIGKIYLDILRKYSQITPFTTNKKTKRKIIEQMQVDIQENKIWLLNDRELKFEFSSYDCKVVGGSTTYSAPSGQHDDIVMASVIANWCFHRKRNGIRVSVL